MSDTEPTGETLDLFGVRYRWQRIKNGQTDVRYHWYQLRTPGTNTLIWSSDPEMDDTWVWQTVSDIEFRTVGRGTEGFKLLALTAAKDHLRSVPEHTILWGTE